MPLHRRLRVVHGQVAWMVAMILALTLLDTFSLEAFFVLTVIGSFVIVGLTEPLRVSPAWRRRYRWIVRLGLLGFCYLVARHTLPHLNRVLS